MLLSPIDFDRVAADGVNEAVSSVSPRSSVVVDSRGTRSDLL